MRLVPDQNGDVQLLPDGMALVPDANGVIRLEDTPPPRDPNALANTTVATRREPNEPQIAPYRPTNAEDDALAMYRWIEEGKDIENPLRGLSPAGHARASFATEYADALLGMPSSIADLATYPVRYAAANPARGPIVGRGSYAQIPGSAVGPKAADVPMYGYAPRLTARDVMAPLAAANQGITTEEARENYDVAEELRRAEHPIADAIGTTGAQVFALSQARSPLAIGLRSRAADVGKKIELAEQRAVARSKIVTGGTEQELRANALKRIYASPAWLKLQRGTGRVVESFSEGAVLGMLQERDPIKSAAYTGGAQAVLGGTTGVLLHNWAKGAFPKAGPAVSLAANVLALSGVAYVAGTVLPGQIKDYEAQKAAAQKIIGSWLVGAVTGSVSARARTGSLSAAAPKLVDALASAPRNTLQSYLIKYLGSDEAGRRVLEQRLQQLQETLPNLSKEQADRVWAAFGRGSDALEREMQRITAQ